MRPLLVKALNQWFNTTIFTYLAPNYLIMLAVGVLAGTLWAVRRARRLGLDPDAMYGVALWAFPAALLGGRLMHWLTAPEIYQGNLWALLDPLRGGSVAYGGLIGGTAAGIVYLVRRRLGLWRYLDCAVPAVGLGTFFTRLGCFLDGDDFGALTTSVLAVQFPAGSPAYYAQIQMGLLFPESPHSLPVHPVQLYLACNGLLLAAVTASWSRWQRAVAGEAFWAYWLLYACTRFGLEFLRGDPGRGFVGPLSTSQAISIPVALVAGAALWQRIKQRTEKE